MEILRQRLLEIDGRGYKAYKVLRGCYRFAGFELCIDHVQGDPFAEPSRIRLCVPAATAALPADSYANPIRRQALEDFLCRALQRTIREQVKGRRGSGHSGEIRITECGQQVQVRDAVTVTLDTADQARVEARLGLALPAAGRRVLAREALVMLFEELPRLVEQGLCYAQLDQAAVREHLESVEDQTALRAWLKAAKLVAFVGDGAILPRRCGIDDRPLERGALPFRAPASLAAEPVLPHAGKIRGMGIPQGVTLIVGGGFHGKSTLLQALELGVYNHIPGDGRERVVTDASAMKIRAEDGRAINRVDISGFINNLPLGQDTQAFYTENASGSTSQAANIMEALCSGASALLIDEDTSATNFMIRDSRMQRLVAPEREPITPLIARVQDLYRQQGVSTILVTGGSSAYFEVADRVILMDQYQAFDASDQARALATDFPEPLLAAAGADTPAHRLSTARTAARRLGATGIDLGGRPKPKIQAFGCEQLRLGEYRIDLGRVEQLVEAGQLRAIGLLIARLLVESRLDPQVPLLDALRRLLAQVEAQGLDQLSPFYPEPHGGLTLPRFQELFAAINRLRELPIESR